MTNETSPSAGLKRCGKCGQWLSRADFSRDASAKDKLQGRCRECSREARAARAQRNRERNAALTVEERQVGPPKKCSTCKRTLPRTEFSSNVTTADGLGAECHACKAARAAARHAANPERRAASNATHYRENSHLYLANKCRQRGGGTIFEVTKRDLDRLWHRQQGKCAYCGVATERNAGVKGAHVDHVIPVSRGGVHSIGNIVYACHRCNGKGGKWNLTLAEWRLARLRAERTSGDLRP